VKSAQETLVVARGSWLVAHAGHHGETADPHDPKSWTKNVDVRFNYEFTTITSNRTLRNAYDAWLP
jgi:hypothetical protein